jgi:hypothetical protein
MSQALLAVAQPVRLFIRIVALLALAALTGCATHFVDGAVRDIKPAEFSRPAQLKPVQVVFEFQTKGVTNARATEFVKKSVIEHLKASGLFELVDDKPVAGGALLSVTLNNVPLTDDAFAKGFMAGLTFGAAGAQVTDGYICTMTYLRPGQASPVVKTARHAIHTTVGAASVPANAYKAASIDEAIKIMVRQILALTLNDLSRDPAFN